MEMLMPNNPSIATLEERHAKLDRDIVDEATRPMPDNEHLSELKREKLRIKDELILLEVT
jgi:hypothetical protein